MPTALTTYSFNRGVRKETPPTTGQKRRILILGGGFGGIYCAKKLQQLLPTAADNLHGFQITLVSKQNFFVFTPMLPQVVSGTIETNHVVVPIRQILRKTKYIEAEVSEIDVINKKVVVRLEDRVLISPDYHHHHYALI